MRCFTAWWYVKNLLLKDLTNRVLVNARDNLVIYLCAHPVLKAPLWSRSELLLVTRQNDNHSPDQYRQGWTLTFLAYIVRKGFFCKNWTGQDTTYPKLTEILDNTYRGRTSKSFQIILNLTTLWHIFNFHNLIIVGAQFFPNVLL